MDVFIMSCVSRSNPSLPLFLPPSLHPSLAHLSSSVCVLHLADRDLISTLLSRRLRLVSRRRCVWGVCVCITLLCLHRPKPPHPPWWLRAGVAMGEGNGVWNLGQEEKEPLHISALFLTGPSAITVRLRCLYFLKLPSIFLLFLAPLVREAEAREIQFPGNLLSRTLVHIHLSVCPLLSPRPLDFLHRSLHL